MPNPAWKKGVSGNPHGRPKKENTWAKILADVGNTKDKALQRKKKQVVADALYQKAMQGDVQASRLIADLEMGGISVKGDYNVTFKWQGENGEDHNAPI